MKRLPTKTIKIKVDKYSTTHPTTTYENNDGIILSDVSNK